MTKTIKDIVQEDYNQAIQEGNTSYLKNVLEQGCVSGIVTELIYYKDTTTFYKEHKQEINELLTQTINEIGFSVDELIKNWDITDPLALDTHNQNLLAWFGYETVARQIYERKCLQVDQTIT